MVKQIVHFISESIRVCGV